METTPELATYQRLEEMIQSGADLPDARLEQVKVTDRTASNILYFRLGALSVNLRQYAKEPNLLVPDQKIRVNILADPATSWLILKYQDGFEDRTVGGSFVITPGGKLSNELSLSVGQEEHGDLTEETQSWLTQVALGQVQPLHLA